MISNGPPARMLIKPAVITKRCIIRQKVKFESGIWTCLIEPLEELYVMISGFIEVVSHSHLVIILLLRFRASFVAEIINDQ